MTYHWSGCDLVLSWCVHHCRSSCVGKYLLCTVYQSSKTVKRQPKQQKWPLVYQSSQVYQDCTNSVPTVYQSWKTVKNSQKTVKTSKMTIGVPIVTGLPRLYQQCTNRQKQSKDSQNSKNDHWCTNRHISTKIVPTVYQQCTNRQKQSKDSQNSKNEGLKLRG